MGDRVIHEKRVGTHVIEERTVHVVRSEWRDAEGLSFDVVDAISGERLNTDESFDDHPTDEQIRDVIQSHLAEKGKPLPSFPTHVKSKEDGQLGNVASMNATDGRFMVEWENGRFSDFNLNDDDPEWEALLSREKATECLEIVQDYIEGKYGTGWDPVLYAPGHEGSFWAITVSGPDEWAIRIGVYDETPFPDGVFAEPVNAQCLGLYPDNH